jgi:alanyl-tRNA synthetase
VLPAELPQTIERMQAEAKAQQRKLGAVHTDLARYRAEELAANAEEVNVSPDAAATAGGAARLVAQAVDADASALKVLASAIVSRPGYIVVLVSLSGPPVVAAIARSADVSLSSQNLLSALQATFGGRGGGKEDFAQGGGMNGSPEAILDAARQALRAHQ